MDIYRSVESIYKYREDNFIVLTVINIQQKD
jgi:hypothetical protein